MAAPNIQGGSQNSIRVTEMLENDNFIRLKCNNIRTLALVDSG